MTDEKKPRGPNLDAGKAITEFRKKRPVVKNLEEIKKALRNKPVTKENEMVTPHPSKKIALPDAEV